MEAFEVRVRRWVEMTYEFLDRLSTDARCPAEVQAEAHRLREICDQLADGQPSAWWPELPESEIPTERRRLMWHCDACGWDGQTPDCGNGWAKESIKKLGVTPPGALPPAADPDTNIGTRSRVPGSGF